MSAPKDVQLLLALQDLEQMTREAQDATNREALEKMGFPVTGLDQLKEAHEKLEARIPRTLVSRYHRLSERLGRAVVPVVDGVCTGCFTNIPSIFTSAVNQDKVVYCETCGRILFWP